MDTWGISGATFLVVYSTLFAGVFVLVALLRRVIVRHRGEPEPPPDLDVYETALLNGGEQLAVAAAAANLREAGTLEIREDDGAVVVSRPLAIGAHPLERRVYAAVRESRQRPRRLMSAQEDDPLLSAMRSRLLGLSLLTTPRQLAHVRMQALWLLPVFGLGCARVVAGSENDKPVAYITLLTLATLTVAIWMAVDVSPLTGSGRRTLGKLRVSAPPTTPLGASVALSGAGALWTADAQLAAAIGLQRESGWGDGGGGGGGGCGGGGCGG